jgi:hypothetical protein
MTSFGGVVAVASAFTVLTAVAQLKEPLVLRRFLATY